jgi:tRNA threonylcarbamoyladenosine biosynthesis protein TsaE
MADHNNPILAFELPDEAATRALGAAIARALAPGLRIYLHGDLGAGKTTLVQGLLAGLGYAGRVKSPTYTLLELYSVSRLNLYHFDFYRFREGNEWREAGFSDYFGGDGVCLVEWPEKAGADLPAADLDVSLEISGSGRRASLIARSVAGVRCCAYLTHYNSQEKSS